MLDTDISTGTKIHFRVNKELHCKLTEMTAKSSSAVRATPEFPGLVDEGNTSHHSLPHIFLPYNIKFSNTINTMVS